MKKQSKKQKLDYTKVTLAAVALLLGISTVWLSIALHNKSKESTNIPNGVHVNLGVMDYTFSGGKATKHDDTNDKALLATLTKTAQKDLELGCRASFYTVKSFNADKSQVRLGYGCNEPSSPMFAIRENAEWQLLSPTNHFDTFGIPDCDYVAKYGLDRSVAPVCVANWNQQGATPQYTVR